MLAPDTDLLSPSHLRRIEDLSLLARVVVDGAMPGIHRSLRQGRGSEFFQYRPYESGEDLKLVDWKVFAKREGVGYQNLPRRHEFQSFARS